MQYNSPLCTFCEASQVCYICLDESCKSYSKHRYFCDDCNAEYHDHEPVDIDKEIQSRIDKWYQLHKALHDSNLKVAEIMQQYNESVNYFDSKARSEGIIG